MSARDWRRDNMRLEGPYGIPAQYLSARQRAQIDAGFALCTCSAQMVPHRRVPNVCPVAKAVP